MHTEKLGDVIMLLYKNLKTKIERELKDYDIGMGQMQILMAFFSNIDQVLSQKDLVKQLGTDKGNISRSVLKLLDKGFIEESSNLKKCYQLTNKGVNLKSEIIPVFKKLHEQMTKDLDPIMLDQTLQTLTYISNNLEEVL